MRRWVVVGPGGRKKTLSSFSHLIFLSSCYYIWREEEGKESEQDCLLLFLPHLFLLPEFLITLASPPSLFFFPPPPFFPLLFFFLLRKGKYCCYRWMEKERERPTRWLLKEKREIEVFSLLLFLSLFLCRLAGPFKIALGTCTSTWHRSGL